MPERPTEAKADQTKLDCAKRWLLVIFAFFLPVFFTVAALKLLGVA